MNNNNKLAVVTGGGSGIGKQLALHFAQNGWDVAFNSIQSTEAEVEVLKELESFGVKALFRQCDVGVKVDVDQFYQAIEETFKKAPDAVVNNAGVQTWSSLLDLEESDWDRVIQTVLKGAFLNIQTAARLMVNYQVKGSIINIGSGCNKLAFPKLVDYAAAKGGVEMLTKVAAVELGENGIRVNCVAPGGILIERTAQESPDYAGEWSKITPMQRVGMPEDIANAVLYFASDKSEFVTGQTLWVDGGVFTKANWPY